MTSIDIYDWGGTVTRPGRGRSIVFHLWDVAGHRVNTGVEARVNLPHPPTVVLVWGPGPPWRRPAVGVQIQGEWIFSFHATSGGGGNAPGVLAAIAGVAGGIPWRVGGDFNRDPNTLAPPGGAALIPAGSVVCPPDGPTHPSTFAVSRYDYFVCNGNAATQGHVDTSIYLSDHWSVDYAF